MSIAVVVIGGSEENNRPIIGEIQSDDGQTSDCGGWCEVVTRYNIHFYSD